MATLTQGRAVIERVVALKPTSAPTATAEGNARPKVMRRPAHFSDAPPSTSVQSIALPDVIAREKPAVISKSWQDDGRFAVALLAIIIVSNLAVMAWLNHIGHGGKPAPAPVAIAAPVVHEGHGARNVTVFAQPEAANVTSVTDSELAPFPTITDEAATPSVHVLDEAPKVATE